MPLHHLLACDCWPPAGGVGPQTLTLHLVCWGRVMRWSCSESDESAFMPTCPGFTFSSFVFCHSPYLLSLQYPSVSVFYFTLPCSKYAYVQQKEQSLT
ncbi:hypothetical protein SKAU_G00213900 [Synaphobranchus kaupii]|uniref:Uncharacterized protein n=1 Tax=Synaphobranchus kaupii TaxID=118154 RepID=A0A9Q1IVB1_SYNKA|nr:hypothetical protein SKAU_G00213900 [Synaphobranchus kaupii]